MTERKHDDSVPTVPTVPTVPIAPLAVRREGDHLVAPVHVRWADLDPYGHVNSVAVVTLLEEARVAALWRLGRPGELPTNALDGGPGASIHTFVAHQRIEYRAPILYPEGTIDIHLWFTRLRGVEADVAYEIRTPASQGGGVAVLAATTLALIDATTGRPRRADPGLREAWEPLLGAPPRFRRGNASA